MQEVVFVQKACHAFFHYFSKTTKTKQSQTFQNVGSGQGSLNKAALSEMYKQFGYGKKRERTRLMCDVALLVQGCTVLCRMVARGDIATMLLNETVQPIGKFYIFMNIC